MLVKPKPRRIELLVKTDFRFLTAIPVSQCHHLVLLCPPPPPCGQSCSLQYPETACHSFVNLTNT